MRSNEDVAVAEPDVPLPAGRDPLRRLGAAGPRLPGARRADVRRHAGLGQGPLDRPEDEAGDSLQLPLDRRTIARSGSRRSRCARKILTQPAFDPFNAGELSPGPSVSTEEEVLDWVARDAETALHPSCTCAMGTGEQSVVDPTSMKVRGLEGVRVVDASVDALRHERQHLRAGRDALREVSRPDQGQHAAGADQCPVVPPPEGRDGVSTTV